MSVVVKGMEMPECCDVCTFSYWSNLHQTASCKLKEYKPCFADFSWEYRSKRADFCPLVALPDHHGRLVDADAIVNAMNDMKVEGEVFVTAVNYVKLIMNDADTIVEAEDE